MTDPTCYTAGDDEKDFFVVVKEHLISFMHAPRSPGWVGWGREGKKDAVGTTETHQPRFFIGLEPNKKNFLY